MKPKAIIVDIIAIMFMILFLYTGISKLMENQVFREQMAESTLLAPFSDILAIALPVMEILVAIALLAPRARLTALYTSSALMILFTLYVAWILLFSPKLPCSCGGILAELSWTQHFVFNSVFVLLAIIGIRLERKQPKHPNIAKLKSLNH